MHVIQTGIIAGLLQPKMDFTFSVRAVNTVSGSLQIPAQRALPLKSGFQGLIEAVQRVVFCRAAEFQVFRAELAGSSVTASPTR